MTDETYDIELPDVSLEEYAMLSTGLSLLQMQIAQAEQMGQPVRVSVDDLEDLITRLLMQNREASRVLVLEAQQVEVPANVQVPEDVLDELGLKLVGGEIVDAEAGDWKDIDVE